VSNSVEPGRRSAATQKSIIPKGILTSLRILLFHFPVLDLFILDSCVDNMSLAATVFADTPHVVRLLDVDTFTVLATIVMVMGDGEEDRVDRDHSVACVEFNATSNLLAAADADGNICIANIAHVGTSSINSGEAAAVVPSTRCNFGRPAFDMHFGNMTDALLIEISDRLVCCSILNGDIAVIWTKDWHSVSCFSYDDSRIVSFSSDKVSVIETSTGQIQFEYFVTGGAYTGAWRLCNAPSDFVVSIGARRITWWDCAQEPRIVRNILSHMDIYDAAFSPLESTFYTALGAHRRLDMWNGMTQEFVRSVQVNFFASLIQFNADGTKIVAVHNNRLCWLSVADGQVVSCHGIKVLPILRCSRQSGVVLL
jgi:hypothetical protein